MSDQDPVEQTIEQGNRLIRRRRQRDVRSEILNDGKILPLQWLIDLMRSDPLPQQDGETKLDYSIRLQEHIKMQLSAAVKAAPYLHPKVAAVDPHILQLPHETNGHGEETGPPELVVRFIASETACQPPPDSDRPPPATH